MNTPTVPRVIPIEINQRVWIKEADVHGIVTGIMLESDCITYRVAYWVDSARRHEWLYAAELGVERA